VVFEGLQRTLWDKHYMQTLYATDGNLIGDQAMIPPRPQWLDLIRVRSALVFPRRDVVESFEERLLKWTSLEFFQNIFDLTSNFCIAGSYAGRRTEIPLYIADIGETFPKWAEAHARKSIVSEFVGLFETWERFKGEMLPDRGFLPTAEEAVRLRRCCLHLLRAYQRVVPDWNDHYMAYDWQSFL